jgi:hypothetical protein
MKLDRSAERLDSLVTDYAKEGAFSIMNIQANTAIKECHPASKQSADSPPQLPLALLCGPQGGVYSVALIVSDRSQIEAQRAYLRANWTKILFALGLACLKTALLSSLLRAKGIHRIAARIHTAVVLRRHRRNT